MKNKTATICKLAITLSTAIVLASFVQAGISFAGNNEKMITNGTIRMQQEETTYPGLATITMTQAKDIVLSNFQGEILKIELEDENGFLVYSVEIVTPEKMIEDIKVDAGNGEILRMEKDTPDENKEEADEQDKDNEHEDKK